MKRVRREFAYGSHPPVVVLDDGRVYEDDDPLVVAYPSHFEEYTIDMVPRSGRGVEQATAAPGERRRSR